MRKKQEKLWKSAWMFVLSFRLWNAFYIVTYFDPDEYWQAPESAHAWLRPGTTNLPWEHDAKLRSALHPMLLVAFSKLWPRRTPIMISSRALHAVVACIADLATIHLAEKLGGRLAGRWTLLLQLTNWFLFYSGPRCYANGIESAMIALAVSVWPEHKTVTLVASAIACALRPSAAAACAVASLVVWKTFPRKKAILVGLISSLLLLCLDSWYYQCLTFTPWNFFSFNVLEDGASYYGVHSWHWYVTSAMPTMVGMLAFVVGTAAYQRRCSVPLVAALIWLLPISLAKHKEFRFALPAVSLLHSSCGLIIATAFEPEKAGDALEKTRGSEDPRPSESNHNREITGPPHGSAHRNFRITKTRMPHNSWFDRLLILLGLLPGGKYGIPKERVMPVTLLKGILLLHLALQPPMAYYFSRIHQRGAVEAIKWLHIHASSSGYPVANRSAARQTARRETQECPACLDRIAHEVGSSKETIGQQPAENQTAMGVMVLARCHATPSQSVANLDVKLAHLDCSPPSHRTSAPRPLAERQMKLCREVFGDLTESDCYEWDPGAYASEALQAHPVDFLVVFDRSLSSLEGVLRDNHCEKRAEFFHAHFGAGNAHDRSALVFQCEGKKSN